VADVQPFRAIRYARPSDSVVAPPYDVLDGAAVGRYRTLDPYNVVHLTLAPDEAEAGRRFHAWVAEGVLLRDEEPSAWVVAQDYVGPDGVARRREGIVASLRVEPYGTGAVLPHERTHAGPKESRLRLLRAARAQLEPIFLLYDGAPPVVAPDGPAELEAEGTRLWRIDGTGLQEFFAERQLLIADGHHRYETALAYAQETRGASDRMLVVLVSTSDPGLEIFPTHRVFAGRPDVDPPGEELGTAEKALARLEREPYERSAVVFARERVVRLVHGETGELDVELVDRFGHDGLSYTASSEDALARIANGDRVFLLRATRIEDVFERARGGEVMPQKTTYFFPKLLSGLLFHPV